MMSFNLSGYKEWTFKRIYYAVFIFGQVFEHNVTWYVYTYVYIHTFLTYLGCIESKWFWFKKVWLIFMKVNLKSIVMIYCKASFLYIEIMARYYSYDVFQFRALEAYNLLNSIFFSWRSECKYRTKFLSIYWKDNEMYE